MSSLSKRSLNVPLVIQKLSKSSFKVPLLLAELSASRFPQKQRQRARPLTKNSYYAPYSNRYSLIRPTIRSQDPFITLHTNRKHETQQQKRTTSSLKSKNYRCGVTTTACETHQPTRTKHLRNDKMECFLASNTNHCLLIIASLFLIASTTITTTVPNQGDKPPATGYNINGTSFFTNYVNLKTGIYTH